MYIAPTNTPTAVVLANAAAATLQPGANSFASFRKEAAGALAVQGAVTVVNGGSFDQAAGSIDFADNALSVGGSVTFTSITNPGLVTTTATGDLSTGGQSLTGGLRVAAGTASLQDALATTSLSVDANGVLAGGANAIVTNGDIYFDATLACIGADGGGGGERE